MLRQDLRYGARMLTKKPLFTLVAVLTVALGIGANTAVFSVFDAVLLRALPYHDGERLVAVNAVGASGQMAFFSMAELQAFQSRMTTLKGLSALTTQSVNLTGAERPDRVRGAFVSANFFRVLNLTPSIGRAFADGEDRAGAPKVVVVKERLWQERLNGDRSLLGRTLTLNGEPYSVIGVVPTSFETPFDPDVEVWIPMLHSPDNLQPDSRFIYDGLGHLAPGVELSQARAEAAAIASQIAQANPGANVGRGAKVELVRELLVSRSRPMLWSLFAAVGVILLIACANLANLLLVRGLARQREIMLRAALGASRSQIIRQLLTETTLLGLAGGAGGLLLGHWGLVALLAMPQNFVRTPDAALDGRVLAFTLALSLLTSWLFGLVPALQLASPELSSYLREGARSSGDARWQRVRGAFVIGQVALSLLLLVGAGLLVRSFAKLSSVDVGFRPEGVLTLEYRLPKSKYPEPGARWQVHRQVALEIQKVPGVQSVSLVEALPFSGNGGGTAITLPDRELPATGMEPEVMFESALPNYFETMGIPLLGGRLFGEEDGLDTPQVLLINQTMARRFWPDQDPVGKRVTFVKDGSSAAVIGVVGDTKHFRLDEEARPQMYVSYTQQPDLFATLVIRTGLEPLSLIEPVRQAIWRADAEQPMWKIRTLASLVERSVADRKFLMTLIGIFAALALGLTAIGLYGVISYLVDQRTREIGIRMALGAQRGDVLRMVIARGMKLVSIGLAIGLGGAWLVTRLISGLLYQVSATDPLTFVAIALSLLPVALLACYLPARRATRVDPLVALRSE